jgi:phage terminase small subunit
MANETIDRPNPPDWLSPEAKKLWVEKLRQLGPRLTKDFDLESLAKFCDQVTRFAAIAQKPKPSIKDHRAMLRLMSSIGKLSDKLGFNPAARARMKPHP